jgi:hypothetical protein
MVEMADGFGVGAEHGGLGVGDVVPGLDQATLDAFAELGFTGDVWAVPEGRVLLAKEPVRADCRAAAHGDPCGGQGRVAACGS